jgi:phenylalanine ammonia-lyase
MDQIMDASKKLVNDAYDTFFELTGNSLTLETIFAIACKKQRVKLTTNPAILQKIKESQEYIENAAKENNKIIYGVTTNYGGMANFEVSPEDQEQLQENLIWGHKCQLGEPLPIEAIRAGMLLRANSLVKGISGIRQEIIERILLFLNNDMTPVIKEYGSIGASGDLIPLSYIAGSVIGLDPSFKIVYQDNIINSLEALTILKLFPLKLRPKEGLALINGTSMMTGIASICAIRAKKQFELSQYIHGFFIQALKGSCEPYQPFIHEQKPHSGQINVARRMVEILHDSKFVINTEDDRSRKYHNKLIQDRYSLRCLPQYMGVIQEGLELIENKITIEANSANDNPLIDTTHQISYHQGNFYGGYIADSMDNLRHYLALLAKHIDVQISLLVTPEFSNGLSASLYGNRVGTIKHGLKGLQICGNSIVPVLLFLGGHISHLYMTHAEQFNQNINSQGFASANLAIKSVDLYEKYLAIALIFAVQSISLRCYEDFQHFDARAGLSPKLIPLFEAIYAIVGKKISPDKAFINQNNEQSMDDDLEKVIADLKSNEGKIWNALMF